MKHQFLKGWSAVLIVALVAAFSVVPVRLAVADSGGVPYHNFNVTFTKWITAYPDMVGVGGGDIGPATFTGEIHSMNDTGDITYVEATYHLKGSKHSFTANVHVTQNDVVGTGSMTGEITDGWLKGGSLIGEYNVYPVCPLPETPGNGMGTLCFQGVLHLRRAP